MVGFCNAFASAEPAWLIRAKAGIAAAMLASNLVINPINYALDDALLEGIDPVGYVQNIQQTPWELYLDQSVIKVVPDTVYIDGVPYSDIWLGPDAADSLRLAGLDFASAYNIANNQSTAISYANGYGYLRGVPLYEVNGSIQSPTYVSSFPWPATSDYLVGSTSIGDFTINLRDRRESAAYTRAYASRALDGVDSGYTLVFGNIDNPSVGLQIKPYNGAYYWHASNTHSQWGPSTTRFGGALPTPSVDSFSFDYTSGIIDAPIDPEDGLLIRIPSEYTSQSSPQYNYDIHDLINIYPTVTQPGGHEINIDPELNPDFEADIDLGNGVGDLIRTILTLLDVLDNIDVKFAPEPDSPEPPPEPGQIDPLPDPVPAPDEPISGTTIADTDYTKLDEILRWIQSTIDSIRHITESLQTMLDSLFDQLQDIIQALQELPEQLLEDIETGPSKVFRKALDILKSLFMPLLLPIKAMMNLWHYVVEWIQSISSPFSWIFGVMSGTSYNMVLPIYAVLAGSICIAIYKALGR